MKCEEAHSLVYANTAVYAPQPKLPDRTMPPQCLSALYYVYKVYNNKRVINTAMVRKRTVNFDVNFRAPSELSTFTEDSAHDYVFSPQHVYNVYKM